MQATNTNYTGIFIMWDSRLFKNEHARSTAIQLYEQKRQSLKKPTESRWIETRFGRTHCLCMGNAQHPPLFVLHGINAGAPIALEAAQDLADDYFLIGVDTVGQATPSEYRKMNLNDTSLGAWLDELIERFGYSSAPVIGVSYGGFLLQKLLMHNHQRVEKAFFVVPAGFVNGKAWETFKRINWPLLTFMLSKKEAHLDSFLSGFFSENDEFNRAFQKNLLLGVHVDFRRPPLLKASDVQHVETPVYLLTAEDDVFFPGKETIERCKAFFPNVVASMVLNGSKHVPAKQTYPEISTAIRGWLKD